MQHRNLREIQYFYRLEKGMLAINACYAHSARLPTAEFERAGAAGAGVTAVRLVSLSIAFV